MRRFPNENIVKIYVINLNDSFEKIFAGLSSNTDRITANFERVIFFIIFITLIQSSAFLKE